MNKSWLRFISMMLTIIMLVNLLPVGALATEIQEAISAQGEIGTEDMTSEVQSEDAHIIGEVLESRTEYSKEFKLSNGLYMAAVYPQAVHYEENGQWEEIDNTLQLTTVDGASVYTNTAGVWDISFPASVTEDTGISITKDGYTLSFYLDGKLNTPTDPSLETMSLQTGTQPSYEVEAAQAVSAVVAELDNSGMASSAQFPETVVDTGSRVIYDNVYPYTSVVYDLQSNQVKESIIVKQYDAELTGYRYILDTGGLLPVLGEDGHIDLYDAKGTEIVMAMPAPFLMDAGYEFTYDVEVSLEQEGNHYVLTYTLPSDWLADEARTWPVVLDPIVTATSTVANIHDQTVYSGHSQAYTHQTSTVGYWDKYGKTRTFLKYDALPTLTSSDVVVSAAISMYKAENSSVTIPVEVHKVNAVWDSPTITWNNQPGFDETVEDYAVVKNQGAYTWDVTDIVREWYETGVNTGMVFKASEANENATSSNFKQFWSVDYSYFTIALLIMYRNNNGLESYWDYSSAAAGSAGTGYVNQYSGNLVWVREDLGFSGNRMPVTISHVYNANDKSLNSFGLGYGWKTNFHQTVKQWSENTSYYIWTDGDGTKHYFKYKSYGVYADEDGLELTLTTTGSGTEKYKITDKNGNVSYFDTNGRLTKMANYQATKSYINIAYTTTSGSNIDYITDGVGRKYTFTYSNSLLSKITYYGTGSLAITYLNFGYTGSQLTSVTDKAGGVSKYTYDSKNLLTSVQDVNGNKISYTYTVSSTSLPPRVETVKQSNGTATGGELTFAYAHNQTTITDVLENVQIIQFNNFGNTISIQDDLGKAYHVKYALDDPDQTSKYDNPKTNQIRVASNLQNTVGNMLQDSSFENGTVWSGTNSGLSQTNTTAEAYRGSRSLAITRSSPSAVSAVYSSQVPVTAGETYTFSAYVKTGTSTSYIAIYSGSSQINSIILAADQDWTRLEVNYTAAISGNITARLVIPGIGTTYLDCVQLEKTPTASRFNLVENGDFRYTGSPAYGWSFSTGCTTSTDLRTAPSGITPPASTLDSNMLKIVGSPTAQKYAYQTINQSGAKDDVYVVAGWARGDSVPFNSYNNETGQSYAGNYDREFGLKVVFKNGSTTVNSETVNFNPDTGTDVNWQYAAAPVIAEGAYTSIEVHLLYDYNMNDVYFDGIQLYKEEFGNSYTYDENGNVTSVRNLQSQNTTYEYNEDNELAKAILPEGMELTYTYDDYHNVLTATSTEGYVYNFAYDTYGNNTKVSITEGGLTMSTSATYANGNLPATVTDAAGKVTTYTYDANTSVLTNVKYPNDTSKGTTGTTYTYTSLYQMASAKATTDKGNALSAEYTYDGDLLASIKTPTTQYTFQHGPFGVTSSISAGGNTLATYKYDDHYMYMSQLTYGNSDYVQYSVNNDGLLTQQKYEDGDTVSYTYDNSDRLAAVKDSSSGITTKYFYDLTNRLAKYQESGAGVSHSVEYSYDQKNNLASLTEVMNGVSQKTTYTYDGDNRISEHYNNYTAAKMKYTYGSFGMLTGMETFRSGTSVLTESYTYVKPTSTTTSGQIATMRTKANSYDVTYTYQYDGNGNITSVSDGTYTTTYVYDTANQLIRENNQAAGKSWEWTYDNAGNILSKKEYAYTTGTLGTVLDTVSYTYKSSGWKDVLASYDGQTVSSDGIGNPITIGNRSFTWEHGRELATLSENGTTWTHTYNADGLRTKRTNGTTTYTYVYNGSSPGKMTVGSNTLYFGYDASGVPMTVTYNGTTYFYATNLQGDVVAILDSSGKAVVKYSYDAWGKLLSTTGSLASTLGVHNPLRYRGYVYDPETGLYYLQSRYYDPSMGRFVNADVFASTGQGLLGNNMFAYCNNTPVGMLDSTGTFAASALIGAALVGGFVSAVSTWVLGGSWAEIGKAFVSGAVEGLFVCIWPESVFLFAGIHFLTTMTECGNTGMHPFWSYFFASLAALSSFGLPSTNDEVVDFAVSTTYDLTKTLIIDSTTTATQEVVMNNQNETDSGNPSQPRYPGKNKPMKPNLVCNFLF